MHDLRTLAELNKHAAAKAHDEVGRRLKAELDALAHKIAREATFGGEDYEAVMEYEITREAIKLHEAKQCTQA